MPNMLGANWKNHSVDLRSVFVDCGDVTLRGALGIPSRPQAVVVFAHEWGSGRNTPRNRFLAVKLQYAGFATLLVDLLSQEEESVDRHWGQFRFNVRLLAHRFQAVVDWCAHDDEVLGFPVAYFGAGVGAAAAVVAAAQPRNQVAALVCRGGRPDLARDHLRQVSCPTQLIVGALDTPLLALNRQALRQLATSEKSLEVVPAASHLFEEPGALEQVASAAQDWFSRHASSYREGEEM